ncbi:Flp pilus assembly protein CpaB [Salisediminibacterium beveridgei]|uniref:Flp pilus assembly protein RcpC/CpaB n=1 Tax=Salisediminibacterium beveridgei TaxID=632773 RepID=A0A1D7QXW6_9BACI|nr:Flp pilus assembly protein CpaB [Salisediminibacterium beveridgei]AOM83861.1 Flp pilus assembly protein RcpC/CpaB [Salisediminibacterium beveridgei]
MRARFVLLLAVVMGIITTALFYQYITAADEATGQEAPDTVEVIKAASPIEENTVITDDMITTDTVYEADVHPMAVKSAEEVAGSFASTYIEEGEILLSHRLKTSEQSTVQVSEKIQDGHRAVSIGASNVQLVTQLIDPEDQVDIVLSETVVVDDEEVNESTVILEDVRVLAVGQRMEKELSETGTREYVAVTLELLPEDAVTVIDAYEKGAIHLTLHSSLIHEEE